MINKAQVEDLASKLAAAVPADIQILQADLEKNFRALIASGLDKMDLVTREEFDIQRKVLARTRAKLDKLEQELEALRRNADS